MNEREEAREEGRKEGRKEVREKMQAREQALSILPEEYRENFMKMQSLYQEKMQIVLSKPEEDRVNVMSVGEESKLKESVSRLENDLMRGAFALKCENKGCVFL
eukprot:GHVR01059576.1.p1 GENE.GHVR01059576.1~~GHVR01059576.1.p1  ORF type:complete len:104 (+),score=23.72 GHVR01059576.1:322-633(+)